MAGKKASVTIYIFWIFIAITLVIVGALAAPLGIRIAGEMYIQGEKMMMENGQMLMKIQDTTVRDQINATMTEALGANQDNITVTANMFQYSWLVVLALSALMTFLYTRRLVEYGGGIV